jgi:hypothetical protein
MEKIERDAGVFTSRGVVELHQQVRSLALEGYRIVTVIDTQNGDYHVVAQKEVCAQDRFWLVSRQMMIDKLRDFIVGGQTCGCSPCRGHPERDAVLDGLEDLISEMEGGL